MFGHLLVGGKIWHKPACLERLNGRIKGKLSPSCFFAPELCRHFIKGLLRVQPQALLGSDNRWGSGAPALAPTAGPWTGLTVFHTWALWKTHFMSLPRIMDSQELGMKSTSSESNSTIQDPLFNCSKSLLGTLLICFCLQYFSHQPGQIYYNYFFPPARKESFRMMLHILWPVDTIDAKKL